MTKEQSPNDGYNQVKTGLRRFGPALIVVGGLMAIIGIGQFLMTFVSAATSDFGDQPSFPILFIILGIPGIFILSIGMMMTQAGYLKELTKYAAKETTPAVTTSVTAVRAAIMDDDVPCPSCASPIEPDSKFCSSCGVEVGTKKCPKCSSQIEAEDRFCKGCGTMISLHNPIA